jgi:hypothetical protein
MRPILGPGTNICDPGTTCNVAQGLICDPGTTCNVALGLIYDPGTTCNVTLGHIYMILVQLAM